MNQAEFILVAQQLAIAKNEGVTLRLRSGRVGVKKLGSHGVQFRAEKRERRTSGLRGVSQAMRVAQMAAARPSLGMKRSASLTFWSSPRVL